MVILSSRLLAVIAGIDFALATPFPTEATKLERRAVIDHDAVVGFAETVPTGEVGDAYLAYKPFLKVVNGCVPFPAVNAAGDTSGGLQTSGDSNGGCESSTGQIYARGQEVNGTFAIMYAWYFPKDSPFDGLGHRHDWESTVVFLSSTTAPLTSTNILAVCPSAHGGFECTKTADGVTLSGNGPLIKYESIFPINHAMGLTSDVGGQQPLVAYESLTEEARDALESTDFGDANVPFKEVNFGPNLALCTF